MSGSFTGSAFIQRFEIRDDEPAALADLSGVCTDGTTFVPMRPVTTSLEVHIQTSSCGLDFTFGPVETDAFVADLTNSHTLYEPLNKKARRALCAVARALSADKGTDQLVRSLNRLIGVKGLGVESPKWASRPSRVWEGAVSGCAPARRDRRPARLVSAPRRR